MRHAARAAIAAALLVLLCISSSVDAKRRPGPLGGRRRVRPTPEELIPVPADAVAVPPAERSSVEVLPEVPFLPEPQLAEETPVAQATCGTYTETDIRPLRTQWNSGNGYCGEMSLQLAAMTRGVYISQKTSRQLGVPPGADHPDLLFEDRKGQYGIYGVAKMLGLYQPSESFWFMDNQTLSSNKQLTPAPSVFTNWMKQNVIAGRPVIGGFRVKGGGYFDYDHIMPVYGACYSTANSLANTDAIVFTDNYGAELRHTPADTYFYAPYQGCGYTGCIPNDYYDMGVAVGPLNAPANLYFPVKIKITAWSDGSRVSREPGEYSSSTSVTASYSLTVKGLTAGQSYRVYRTTGLFSGNQIPQTADSLAATCTTQGSGCVSVPFTATSTTATLTQTFTGTGTKQLGRFRARSVTYFLVVKA